jgi:MurNAc alpha-1-phosphate uridylyltransferase
MSKITQAMIFAAGHATRMRPLTDNLPKPLLRVNGQPLLTHIIDHLIVEGVTTIIINGFHAMDRLSDYMNDIRAQYPDGEFILSEEGELLETGGGAVKALPHIDMDAALYMINGDAYWVHSPRGRTLDQLHNAWNDEMECLLLLQSTQSMDMTEAVGDYDIGDSALAKRSHDKTGQYMFTGIRIIDPKIMKGRAVEKFSFLEFMDGCENNNTLHAIAHEGDWYHLSTPVDLDEVNAMFTTLKKDHA